MYSWQKMVYLERKITIPDTDISFFAFGRNMHLPKLKFMRTLLTILFFLFAFQTIKSQDALFSQFNNTPLLLNPSLAGQMEGNSKNRLLLNQRNQWLKAFRFNSSQVYRLSYDRQID